VFIFDQDTPIFTSEGPIGPAVAEDFRYLRARAKKFGEIGSLQSVMSHEGDSIKLSTIVMAASFSASVWITVPI